MVETVIIETISTIMPYFSIKYSKTLKRYWKLTSIKAWVLRKYLHVSDITRLHIER